MHPASVSIWVPTIHKVVNFDDVGHGCMHLNLENSTISRQWPPNWNQKTRNLRESSELGLQVAFPERRLSLILLRYMLTFSTLRHGNDHFFLKFMYHRWCFHEKIIFATLQFWGISDDVKTCVFLYKLHFFLPFTAKSELLCVTQCDNPYIIRNVSYRT